MQDRSSIPHQEDDSSSSDSSSANEEDYSPPYAIRAMTAYLYFIQGLVSSIAGTVPYTYSSLPDYLILSVFSMSSIPYSFKFVTAPIVQKYSSISYGKRKTWIIISQIFTSFLVFLASFFVQKSNALVFAWFTVSFNLSMSLQDIALDGLALKQLRSRSMMSKYQAVFQMIGGSIGGLTLLKLTSFQFSTSVGLESPITDLRTILIVISVLLMVPTLIIHNCFQQTFLASEVESLHQSLYKVFSIYKVYLFPSYRYFRNLVFLLLYFQGCNLFMAGYNYELINAGFSRDTMNTIDNINMIPQTILMFVLGTYANYLGFTKSIMIYMSLLLLHFVGLYIWFPVSSIVVAIVSFTVGILSNWDFLISTIIAANFPECGFTSMLYTMGASASNGGHLMYIQVALLKIWPWRTWALIGMLYTLLAIIAVPKAFQLIESGRTDLPANQ